jgi:hypothetical protein
MNDKYKLLQENPSKCKRLFGVDFNTFEYLLGKVQKCMDKFLADKPLSNRGVKSALGLENQLLLTLEYLRQYTTFLSLGFSYGISESWAQKCFHRIRQILSEEIGLKNPAKLRRRAAPFKHIQRALVDVTVQPIERPQQEQEKYYNGSGQPSI